MDDYTPLRNVNAQNLASDTMLFPVRDALWYLPRMPLGEFKTGSKASQGDAYYVAENPPFGAVITYYLPKAVQTAKEKRRETEKDIEKQGGNTPYPGWDALRAEATEEEPAVVLTVRNSNGEVIRKLEGPAKAGFHRVAWDLRYPESSPWEENPEDDYIVFSGPLAAPGNYTVSLATRVNGVLKETGLQSAIHVKMMRQNSLATASATEVVAFGQRLDNMMREGDGADAVIEALLDELAAVKQTLVRSGAEGSLRDQVRALELEVLDLDLKLSGDEDRDMAGDSGPVSVRSRIGVAQMGTSFSSYGPTPMHERSLDIAEQDFAAIKTALRRIYETELPALRKAMDDASVPWTPGRGVPGKG